MCIMSPLHLPGHVKGPKIEYSLYLHSHSDITSNFPWLCSHPLSAFFLPILNEFSGKNLNEQNNQCEMNFRLCSDRTGEIIIYIFTICSIPSTPNLKPPLPDGRKGHQYKWESVNFEFVNLNICTRIWFLELRPSIQDQCILNSWYLILATK